SHEKPRFPDYLLVIATLVTEVVATLHNGDAQPTFTSAHGAGPLPESVSVAHRSRRGAWRERAAACAATGEDLDVLENHWRSAALPALRRPGRVDRLAVLD